MTAWKLVQGSSTLCSSKNSSTRFYICSFTEIEDSNSVLYPVLHILTIFPTSVTMILTDRQCKVLSGRVSSQCNQVFTDSFGQGLSIYITHLIERIYYFETRQALL